MVYQTRHTWYITQDIHGTSHKMKINILTMSNYRIGHIICCEKFPTLVYNMFSDGRVKCLLCPWAVNINVSF